MQTGSDAFALLAHPTAETRVDIILKAHDPPDSNGPLFLKRIKEKSVSPAAIPVIGMSSFSRPAYTFNSKTLK